MFGSLSPPYKPFNLFSSIPLEKQPLWSPLLFSLSLVCAGSLIVILVKFWKAMEGWEYAQSTIFTKFLTALRHQVLLQFYPVGKLSQNTILLVKNGLAASLGLVTGVSPKITVYLGDSLCLFPVLTSCFLNPTSSSFLVMGGFCEIPKKSVWEINLLVLCI